jgi:hypothetical protein
MRRVVDLNVPGGTILIAPPADIPMPIQRAMELNRTPALLIRISTDRAALAELRREWSRLPLPAPAAGQTDRHLLTIVERELAYGRLLMMFVPADNGDVAPAAELGAARPQAVALMSASEKIAAVLERAPDHLKGEAREALLELIEPTNIAIAVGMMLGMSAAMAASGGTLAAVLVGFAYASAGIAGITALANIIETIAKATNATSDREIDECAQVLARAIVQLGVAFVSRFLGKAKLKTKGKVEREVKPVKPVKPAGKPEPPFNRVLGEKGRRPPPEMYLDKKYIDAHLKRFDNGAVKIVRGGPPPPPGKPGPKPPPGTIVDQGAFVIPKDVADDIIKNSKGPRDLEQKLGLPKGYLGDDPQVLEIKAPKSLKMASGNEPGANEFWEPGGMTSGGLPEAVINPSELKNAVKRPAFPKRGAK